MQNIRHIIRIKISPKYFLFDKALVKHFDNNLHQLDFIQACELRGVEFIRYKKITQKLLSRCCVMKT